MGGGVRGNFPKLPLFPLVTSFTKIPCQHTGVSALGPLLWENQCLSEKTIFKPQYCLKM